MIIKCINCKKEFEQRKINRVCDNCVKKERSRINRGNTLLLNMKRQYQNPIHQWYKEFVTTEAFPTSRSKKWCEQMEMIINESL